MLRSRFSLLISSFVVLHARLVQLPSHPLSFFVKQGISSFAYALVSLPICCSHSYFCIPHLRRADLNKQEAKVHYIPKEDFNKGKWAFAYRCYGKVVAAKEFNLVGVQNVLNHTWNPCTFKIIKLEKKIYFISSLHQKTIWSVCSQEDHGISLTIYFFLFHGFLSRDHGKRCFAISIFGLNYNYYQTMLTPKKSLPISSIMRIILSKSI